MYTILAIVQVLVAVALIGLILIQHGKGADAGAAFGSGASGTVFGSRGSANFLSRATAWLATIFFCASLALAYLVHGQRDTGGSVVDRAVPAKTDVPDTDGAVPADPAPTPADAEEKKLPVVPE
jgi:preprotein translocase subunit SecG